MQHFILTKCKNILDMFRFKTHTGFKCNLCIVNQSNEKNIIFVPICKEFFLN